jgi:hypothetical protein
MVPEEMRGVWRRRSIAVDDGAPAETAHVLWLQAAEAFADLRVPNSSLEGRVEAFAGATTWDPPRLTWHHAVDWNGGFAGYDCGDIEWRDGALVERGTFDDRGRTRVYEEIWDRIDPGDHYVALTAGTAMIVQVGAYSLALRDGRVRGATFDVRAARWSAELGWQDTYSFGAGRELPLAEQAGERAAWTITESTPAPAPH